MGKRVLGGKPSSSVGLEYRVGTERRGDWKEKLVDAVTTYKVH